jgi:diguanylate cyclase (GGDEF)-like protein
MDLSDRQARHAALDIIGTPVWIFDLDLRQVHWANRAALRVWDAPTLEELCARDMGRDMSESVARRLAQFKADFIAHAAVFQEHWTLYPGGKPVSLNIRYSGVRLPDGRMAMLCEGHEREAMEPESLRSVEALLHTTVMITLYGRDGRALYRNPAARAAAREPGETLAERIVEPGAHLALVARMDAEGVATQTLAVETAAGRTWHEISARRCRDAVTGEDAVLVSEVDVSALKRTEAQAQFLALHDSLTGLPNRSHVMQRFGEAVEVLRRTGQEAALLFIDLDHFKDINDTLGHETGDTLLVEVARRLRHAVRGADLVARLGGDEFLILMVGREIRGEIERVRSRLMRTVAEPVRIGGQEVRVTPSLGVALYPADGSDFETLLRNADLAMYNAKERGRNDLAFYAQSMSDAVRSRMALEAELRRAVEAQAFEVHYQAIVESGSGRIVGAEALARWRHPERGMVPPSEFIPVCESTGLIQALGAQVFATAARQQAAWAREGFALHVSVNLSARQLRHAGLLQDLQAGLAAAGCDPRAMQVEITESMLLGHDEGMLALMRAIEATGMSIALDDFGTGYSNLGYLQRFPIRTLKIDRSFIQSLDANRPLAEMIVSLSRLMQLGVVAEGVETQEQLDWVRTRGIAQCQGFLFARPLPAEAFGALLRAPRPLPAGA